MKILFVAYPMLPVSDATCGGAEQMLYVLEREMAQRGHQTVVAGCNGSRVAGELFPTGEAPSTPDAFEMRAASHAQQIMRLLRNEEFDLIHDKSGFFWKYAGELQIPVLATLHLPPSHYPEDLFRSLPQNLRFNCVSESQLWSFGRLPEIADVVPNGIALERFPFARTKRDYVLWLGRICPEKAPHLAIDAAERAGVRLIMAGQVYPFSWHQRYFENKVRPRLDRARNVEWLEPPSFENKVKMLAEARAVLLPTRAPETSSLVAMEAMACGTPVIAFPNGALPEIVRQGVTGFLVKDAREMADAIANVHRLRPEDAYRIAQERFSACAMADRYEVLYERVLCEFKDEAPLAA